MKNLLSVFLLIFILIGYGCSNENAETSISEVNTSENIKPTVTPVEARALKEKTAHATKPVNPISSKEVESAIANTPTPVVLLDVPPVEAAKAINALIVAWTEGYSRNTDLDVSMELSVSGNDLTQSLPLKIQGKVDKASNFEGTLDSWDSNGRQSVQLITFNDSAYYKSREATSWTEIQSTGALLTPYSVADILINNIHESFYVSSEIMGGVQTHHLKGKVESRKFGSVIRALEGSAGLFEIDLWVEIESSRLGRFTAVGGLVGGPSMKGPNGEKVNIDSSIRYTSWSSDGDIVIVQPELPPTPNNLQWESAPKFEIDTEKDYQAVIKIFNGGEILIDLLEDEVPITVNNFVFLAQQGFYDGITFHRVIPGFMAQTGDPTGTGRGGPGYSFQNEFHPSARHDSVGTVSMANAGMRGGKGTNGSQFFITYRDTSRLDGLLSSGDAKDCEVQGTSCHSVFGKVIQGMDLVDQISPRDPSNSGPPGDSIESVVIIIK